MQLSPRAISITVLAACGLLLSSCGFDREYRLRFWEKCRIGAAQALHKKQYKFARVLAEESVAQAQGFGDSDFRLGVSLCGLADVEKAQGKRQQSEEVYKRSIKVLEAAENQAADMQNANMKAGKHSAMIDADLNRRLAREDLANALYHLADLYATEERFQEAANYFERAAGIYESMLNVSKWTLDDCPMGQQLVYSLLGLAEVSIQQKNLDAAAAAYKRSLVFAVASNCPEFLLLEIRDGYLKVLRELGKTEEAQKLLADEMCTKFAYEGNQAFGREDYAAAEKFFQQAYAMAQQSIFSDRRIMHSLYLLANSQVKLNKTAELRQVCKLADNYMENKHLRFDKDYDGILHAEANLDITYGNPAQAVEALAKQYRYRVQEYGPNSIPVCDTLTLKAKSEYQSGNIQQAERTALGVYRILKAKHISSKRASSSIFELALLFGKLNRLDLDFELQQAFLNVNIKRMDPSDSRIVAYRATVFMEYAKYGAHDLSLNMAKEITEFLKTATEEQKVESFKYLVLMMAQCTALGWFDVGLPIAEIGQKILHEQFHDQLPDEISRTSWTKDIVAIEKHFGRKF